MSEWWGGRCWALSWAGRVGSISINIRESVLFHPTNPKREKEERGPFLSLDKE